MSIPAGSSRLPPAPGVPAARSIVVLALALSSAGCIARAREIQSVEVDRAAPPARVTTPVRAHLGDGSVVVFRSGFTLAGDTLEGVAWRHDLTRRDSARVEGIALDSVIGLETFVEGENRSRTLAASIPLSVVGVTAVAGGSILIFKAIFGSCPTIYSDSGGVALLEAEGFSYSIAPLFEMRDVDRLRATPDADGVVELEVRNEALETHYIDHFGVLEVHHAADEWVAPDAHGGAVAMRTLVPPARARDHEGSDVLAIVTHADGDATRAAAGVLVAAEDDALQHALELSLPAPDADSVALVLRLRNSLLNTVLLYEFMLDRPGTHALDWLGSELSQPATALELGVWYASRMGLRVQVRDGAAWREVARVGDSGPIAWKDLALPIPVLERDSLRVRIVQLTDSWRIDRIAFGLEARRVPARSLQVAEVIGADGQSDEAAAAAIRAPDRMRLSTGPGDRFVMRFHTDAPAGDVARGAATARRTFLLDARGYYTEWIRPEWVRHAASAGPFRPDDDMLVTLVRRWAEVRDDFELRFFETRVPVR